MKDNAPMDDHRCCRLSVSGGELELAGPPAALRALGRLLRQHPEPFEVAITGGVVSQEATAGPLLVSLQGGTTLHFSGGREYLDILWDGLDGVAEQAETADDRAVRRHQHIEYLPGDDYRSPDSVPLVIVADWPGAP
ncbi:Imm32 family immunity protein [Micromonospora sp. AB353]